MSKCDLSYSFIRYEKVFNQSNSFFGQLKIFAFFNTASQLRISYQLRSVFHRCSTVPRARTENSWLIQRPASTILKPVMAKRASHGWVIKDWLSIVNRTYLDKWTETIGTLTEDIESYYDQDQYNIQLIFERMVFFIAQLFTVFQSFQEKSFKLQT